MTAPEKKIANLLLTGIFSGLAGCGGSSNVANIVLAPATMPTSWGVFLDSPVQGLHYDTPTLHGETDANGRFQYVPGESIQFSLGGLQFQTTQAKAVVTPLDLAGTTNASTNMVSNMLVLLQSLDADSNTVNGIQIPVNVSGLVPSGIDLQLSPANFRSNPQVLALLNNALGPGRTLVAEASARSHFQSSLNTGVGGTRINIAPHADAGIAQSVNQGATVTLDGSASGDANGDTLHYQWTLSQKPIGSSAAMLGAGTVAPTFVADTAGTYIASLAVSDGVFSSSAATVQITAASSGNAPAGYVLVWSDEFNTSLAQLPDSNKWAYDTSRNSAGWYNGELQYYSSSRTQNAVVQNGSLVITARKESLAGSVSDWGGQSYTSARLYTKGKASWTYGFFDIRAKLPCGAGTWPAIWALGSTVDIWPDQGEIDIMEQTGWDKSTVLGTVHTLAGFGGAGSTGSTTLPGSCTSFHNYQIKWTADSIAFYVDGVPYRQPYTKPANTSGWPFDKAQYLLLNLAVGGVLGGSVNDATLSSTSMEVDYVRVYQLP